MHDLCTDIVLELGGFASQFATHFYRVANQFSKWFAVCESFYEDMDCFIIHLLLMPATRNKPVWLSYQLIPITCWISIKLILT